MQAHTINAGVHRANTTHFPHADTARRSATLSPAELRRIVADIIG